MGLRTNYAFSHIYYIKTMISLMKGNHAGQYLNH